jgi:hypothetical protein
LPDNFWWEERGIRYRICPPQARAANRLLVTSEEVRRDLATFAPAQVGKARLIPYVADLPAAAFSQDPTDGLAGYHLPETFISLPNQFWQHKNHQPVFGTLARLRPRGVRPQIVSTVNQIDYRQSAHFADLMQRLSRMNIRDQFIYLGQVPRIDVFCLMRLSVCVLNPSQCEGLGLSVAE